MNLRLVALSVAVAAAVAIVAGCGGDDDGDDASASSISKEQFIAKADAICEKATLQLNADFAAYLKKEKFRIEEGTTGAEAAGLVENVLKPNTEKELTEIRALGVPSGDEDEVEAIFVAVENGVEKAMKDPSGLARGEIDLFGESGELARNYGFKACGRQ